MRPFEAATLAGAVVFWFKVGFWGEDIVFLSKF